MAISRPPRGRPAGVIHCGDTVWLGVWWHIGRQLGPFDAAFLPINGARVPDAGMAARLTPEHAAGAALALGPGQRAIHYGLNHLGVHEEYPQAPPAFRAAASARKVRVSALAAGEWLRWE